MKAHLQAYAVVAEDAVVDLDELVDRTALGQCCIRTARQALGCPSLAARCFGATPCCCRQGDWPWLCWGASAGCAARRSE